MLLRNTSRDSGDLVSSNFTVNIGEELLNDSCRFGGGRSEGVEEIMDESFSKLPPTAAIFLRICLSRTSCHVSNLAVDQARGKRRCGQNGKFELQHSSSVKSKSMCISYL